MVIKDWRYAASSMNDRGEYHRFDDIGDMLAFSQKDAHGTRQYWVHDMSKGGWINAAQASFILDSNLKTPMHWGIAAFAEEEDAISYVTLNGGQSATWNDLVSAVSTITNTCGDRSHPTERLIRIVQSDTTLRPGAQGDP